MGILLAEESKSRACEEEDDVVVDITKCTNYCENALVEDECQDATENCSTSFEGSTVEDGSGSLLSDCEVESRLCCNTNTSVSASVFDEFGEPSLFRKKRLTDHWRKFIHPLMWRCKWIELQIKEIKSQALKYDKELAEYDQMKRVAYERILLEGFNAKTLPFSSHFQRKKVMKRKKRKRVEETIDISSYLSQHNVFSYYENKRSVADAPLDIDCGNVENIINGNDEFGLDDGWSSLEFRNGDDSLEPILRKIEVVQSQVHKLKTRMGKVLSEHAGTINKLSLLVPCHASKSNSSDQNPASPKNGDRMLVKSLYNSPHRISECNKADIPMPESAGLSHGEVTPLPNMIEFTDQHQVVGSYDNCVQIENEILIHNQGAAEDFHNFETIGSQLIKQTEVLMEEQPTTPSVLVSEAATKTSLPCVESNANSLPTLNPNAPRNTKRRGSRRGGSSR